MGKPMRHTYLVAVAVVLILGALFLCMKSPFLTPTNTTLKQENISRKAVTITTYNSNHELETETFDKAPSRVIAIWQGPIETLLALGLGDRIVAATGVPSPEFLRAELRGDYEKIPYRSFDSLTKESALVMEPDFIITSWESAFSEKQLGTTSFWHQRKVKTYIGEIPVSMAGNRTLEHEYKVILDLGKIFRVEKRAEKIVNGMKSRMEDLQEQANAKQEKPSVMIVQYMGNKLVNWGDEYLQADMVRKLGGRLLLHTKGQITEEEILYQQPDVIFLMINEWDYAHKENILNAFMNNPSLNSLPCIQQQRVYLLPLYEGQYSGVRTAEGLEHVAKGLYHDIR